MYVDALAPHLLSEAQRRALRDPVKIGITRTQMITLRPHAAQASPRGSAPSASAAQASTEEAVQETTPSAEEWIGAPWAASDQGQWVRGRWR